MDLNKVMIIGNVVRDPDIRTTPSGQTVASFSVATNLVWKDKEGQKQKKAEFHNIVAWRRLGEIVGQGVTENHLRDEAKRQGMITLRQDGVIKALGGLVSIQETPCQS